MRFIYLFLFIKRVYNVIRYIKHYTNARTKKKVNKNELILKENKKKGGVV